MRKSGKNWLFRV
ncbi:MAG: KxYKxGKxW signal peptide domain-containing protein [Moraxellaceae bacterium]|nr:KxYKxGKxW signal peptide domain-containing protein [Moraxellaceae bacterium]